MHSNCHRRQFAPHWSCFGDGPGSSYAGPKSNADLVTLVARKGGGGGMKGMSRSGGGGMKGLSRSGGGAGKLSRSGGNRSYALRSGGGSSHMKRGSMSSGNYALKNGGYKNRNAFKGGGKKHYASKDRNHNKHANFNNRHRVFRNGAWIWVYGSGYTAYGNDCYWLRRQAIATGSPYWWSRYNQCVGYDYY
jgi:hypothetical protein